MKKRHILFVCVALLMLLSSILPAFVTKLNFERGHRGYVAALALNDTAEHFSRSELYAELFRYKESGINTAVLHESTDGSFNTILLDLAKLAGLDAAVCVTVGEEKSLTYEKNLKALVKKYEVKYLLLKSAQTQTHEAPIAECIRDNNLTLVLCENKNQLSNEQPLGFENYVAAANGRIMRCYETNKTQPGRTEKNYDPMLIRHQMLNSARDRNTEFLLIQQITDAAATPAENAAITQNAVADFCAKMNSLGYTPGLSGTLEGYNPNLKAICAAGALLGVLMLIPMLYILRKKSTEKTEWYVFAFGVFAYAITWALPLKLVLVYPTLFATISACLCFTICLLAADRLKNRLNTIAYTCAVIAIGLLSLLICIVVLSAMLSGAAFYLNIYIFRGVAFALIVPVLYALALTALHMQDKSLCLRTLKTDVQALKSKIRPRHIVLFAVLCLLLVIYLLRSGNTTISATETTLRNLIGEISGARPRTKEFLIGWPALALFAFYVKQNRSKLLQLMFAAGSSILFASVMNTFCHVFADTSISLLRTMNGILFAIPFLLLYVAANCLLQKSFFSKKLDNPKNS